MGEQSRTLEELNSRRHPAADVDVNVGDVRGLIADRRDVAVEHRKMQKDEGTAERSRRWDKCAILKTSVTFKNLGTAAARNEIEVK